MKGHKVLNIDPANIAAVLLEGGEWYRLGDSLITPYFASFQPEATSGRPPDAVSIYLVWGADQRDQQYAALLSGIKCIRYSTKKQVH